MTHPRDRSDPICTSGKLGFPDEQAARAVLATIRDRRAAGAAGRRPGQRESAVYCCPACGWWHLATHARGARRGVLANSKSTRRRR